MEPQKPITLLDAVTLLEQYNVDSGYLVGGIAEKGMSLNDIDIITSADLPQPFHVVKDSEKPQGPAVDIKKLGAVKTFLGALKFMKPKKTAGASQEYYNLQDFRDFKGQQYVEPKWDGIRVAVAKIGPAVLVRTDEGNFIEDKLQDISEDVRKIPYDIVILDAELVVYIRGKRGDHSDVTAYLHSSSPSEDYHLKLKPFDVLYLDGIDTRSRPLSERKQLLEKVSWSEFIHPVKFLKVDGSQVIWAIKSMTTAEGAMVKDAESTYNEAGDGWYKLKWQQVIDAKVVAVEKKEGGYIYTCEAGGANIGKTYATDKVAKEGDIIAVSVDHITRSEGGGFTWYAPKVIGVRKDKSEPDTAAVLERMAASRKVETNASDPNQGQGAPVLEGPFVLHEHWWGEKHHFDLRFEKTNAEGKKVMIGFTLFANSLDDLKSKLAGGEKILAKEKDYHAPEWLTFHGDIPPGQTGNPTENLVAHMEIRDRGHYSFARRQYDFVDMTLDGSILKGRYYVRKVALKNNAPEDPNKGPRPGQTQPQGQSRSETATLGSSWLFWQARAQNNAETAQDVFQDSVSVIDDETVLEDTAEGLLIKNAVLCRAMVLDYAGKKVLKSPEELAKSMVTVQRMMVTDDHPAARLISNVSEIKGRVIPVSVTLVNNAARGNLLITDTILAGKIKKGKRDLSPGYLANVVDEKGTFNDEPYQAVQRNIIYDHIAVVDRGRCPRPQCGILDSDDILTGDEVSGDQPAAGELSKIVSKMRGMLQNMPEAMKATMSGIIPIIEGMVEAIKSDALPPAGPAGNSTDDSKTLVDGVEKQLGKMQQMALSLDPTQREQIGRFVEAMNSLLLITHRIHAILSEMPKEKHDAMSQLIKQLTRSMGQMMDEADAAIIKNTSNSSENDGIKSSEDKMTESIVVDGVTHTPETIRKLVADSAALAQQMQKTATEAKVQLDAAVAETAGLKTQMKAELDAKDAEIAGMKARIDAIETERRSPLVKQITDAIPMLKAEDLAAWDYKRLVDTANLISQDRGDLEAVKLRMKNDSSGTKGGKSIVEDAYAKVGAEGDK